MKSSAVHRLRLVSAPEAVSFIVLLVCSVLKRTTDFDAVRPMGYVHGVLFVLYLLFLADAWKRQGWDLRRAVVMFLLAVVPTGGFFAERKLAREEREGYTPAAAAADADAAEKAAV